MARNYHLRQHGEEVQAAIDKIIALGPATHSIDGTMTAADKRKLDSLGIKYGTTAFWNNSIGYIPPAGEIIIYSDYKTIDVDGEEITIPGIKIGSGNGYVQDLAFFDEAESGALLRHIADDIAHVSAGDRSFWNNKLNVDDSNEVVGESLILNRN